MKTTIFKTLLGIIAVPIIIVLTYFGWQFSWSQIHTANCVSLNKEYTPKTYTLKNNPNIQMQVDSLYNPTISSTYSSVSGLLLYPGIKYGCSVETTKNFYYTLKFKNYPDLKVYYQSSLYLSYDNQKADYDKEFEELLNRNNNWRLTEYDNGAFLKSQTGRFISFGEGNANLDVSASIYIYTNSGWGELNLTKPENKQFFSNFLANNNLLKSSFVSFNPYNIESDGNLLIDISARTDGANYGQQESSYTDLSAKIELIKSGGEYIIKNISKV